MMSPASSNPVLTEKGHPTIMRLYGRDDAQGAFIAPWIAEKYKGKKIAILHDKSAYGKGLATVVKDKLNAAGVTEVLFEGINPGEKDYTRDRHQAEGRRRRVRLFRRLSPRGGAHAAPGGRPGLQAPADDRRQPRDLRVLADFGAGGRRRALHLPDRSAPLAGRRPCARAVQGAGLQSRRLHPVQLRRRPGDRRRRSRRRAPTIRKRSPRRSRAASRSRP